MIENPFEKWEILNVRIKKGRDKFHELLTSNEVKSVSADCIYEYLMRPLKGKKLSYCWSVIKESNYFDQDFVDCITSFYSKGFRDISKLCTRLHFFSSKITDRDLYEIEGSEIMRKSYLGFCVLRPLENRIIGRTALKPRLDHMWAEFHTCTSPIPINLAGNELVANAAVQMEQDARIQTCSSVAIWMSSYVMSHNFKYPIFTTTKIMEYATKHIVGARVGPTDGLTYEQMMQALKEMGYEPIIFGETDPFETKNQIYAYVESSIPPILLLQQHDGYHHAITAIGHAHKRPSTSLARIRVVGNNRVFSGYYRSSEWVPYFFVNDDQRGIYRELEFLTRNSNIIIQRIKHNQRNAGQPINIQANIKNWHCPVAIKTNSSIPYIPKETIANVWGMIAPIPKGVTLSHVEAEEKAVNIINRCISRSNTSLPRDLVIRSYLILSNQYKLKLVNRTDMSNFVRAFYQGKPLPKWIWVFELSTSSLMNKKSIKNIRIRGEVILDASSNPDATDFLVFHWILDNNRGTLLTMKQEDKNIAEALRQGWRGKENPYMPLIRA